MMKNNCIFLLWQPRFLRLPFFDNKAERNPILNMKHVNRNKSAGGLIVDGEKWKYRELGIDG